jgi:hypothetical protein
MKSSDSASFGPQVPSLFQIAAFFEDFFPSQGYKCLTNRGKVHLPIAEYMLNPEKLEMALAANKADNSMVQASVINPTPVKRKSQAAGKRPIGSRPGKNEAGPENNGSQPSGVDGSRPGLARQVKFSFHSPSANSVKLAGDFTGWDAHPIDLMRSSEGIWSAVVSLAPGLYSYRFIVDGHWCDDPNSERRIPNPFGSANAELRVT